MAATEAQHLTALARANRVRLLRAPARRAVAALPGPLGRLLLAELLESPPDWLDGERIDRLLQWPRNMGAHFMRRALLLASSDVPGAAPIGELRLLGELTERERRALAAWLRGSDGRGHGQRSESRTGW